MNNGIWNNGLVGSKVVEETANDKGAGGIGD